MSAPTHVAAVRVFLCDDTADLRRRVRERLQAHARFEVIGEADDPVDGLPLIGQYQPDAVVLDLSMPRMDGFEALEHIRRHAPGSAVVIYSGFLAETMAARAITLGADRYVEKGQTLDDLMTAIDEAVADRRAGVIPLIPEVDVAVPPTASAASQDLAAGRETTSAPDMLSIDAVGARLVVLGAAAVAAACFAGILAVGDARVGVGNLLALPVALIAMRLGLTAGLLAATAALVIVVAGAELADASPGFGGYVVRAAVFFLVSILVGRFAEAMRREVRNREATTADLERSNAELEQFAYIASHDLAEPLRTIRGFTEMLARRYEGALDEKADGYIRHVVGGTARMQQLIDDLLAYSRVGRAEINPGSVSLADALDRVTASLSGTIEETHAEIVAMDLPVVVADERQIAQVLQNLVGNALKFQRPDARPRIRISAERDGGMWRIDVADNGIGVDPRFTDRVFRMFQRLHAQHEYSGTGIGLAICERIVERNGGRIWVKETAETGTTFSFTLPGAD